MTKLKATSNFFHLPSYLLHLPSYLLHLTSFRTSPVPFNLEGAPPLSCILPPQGEANRSACRSYIMVSADHQRSGFFCALRRKFNVKGLRSKGTSTFLPLTSYIILQTSDIGWRSKVKCIYMLIMLIFYFFVPRHGGERGGGWVSYLCSRNRDQVAGFRMQVSGAHEVLSWTES